MPQGLPIPLTPQQQLQYELNSGNPQVEAEAKNIIATGSALTPEQKQAAAQADLASSDPQIRAQGQYLQTGQAPPGYSVNEYGTLQKNSSLMDAISNSVGTWGPIAVGAATGLFSLPALFSSGAGASIPDLSATTGFPTSLGTDVTAAGTAIPGGAAGVATGVPLDAWGGAIGTNVTGPGTALPGSGITWNDAGQAASNLISGGNSSSYLSKILNPKNLTQNAIKGLTSQIKPGTPQQQGQPQASNTSGTSTHGYPQMPSLQNPPITPMPGFGGLNFGQVQPDVSADGGQAQGQLPLPSIIQQLISNPTGTGNG